MDGKDESTGGGIACFAAGWVPAFMGDSAAADRPG
jgi:hypothetical protein